MEKVLFRIFLNDQKLTERIKICLLRAVTKEDDSEEKMKIKILKNNGESNNAALTRPRVMRIKSATICLDE